MQAAELKTQQDSFARLYGILGPDVALFCLCAVYDLPYDDGTEAGSWDEYLQELQQRPQPGRFCDGKTDVNTALLAGMDASERWETIWGDGYSENDYKRLDDLYRTMTAQLDAAGGVIDKQQEDTARYCSRLALQRETLTKHADKDSVDMAAKLDKMIRDNLKDCNMRKADVLPTQMQRLDGFVDALRKKTGLEAEMTQEDVLRVFHNWCRKKKYPMTTDAADHMLLSILKTMAKNDDLPEPAEIDESMSAAAFESEFASEPNEQEIDSYAYFGFVRGGAVGES